MYNQRVIKTRVGSLPPGVCPARAGVILFATTRDSLWFGLGTHSQTHELTDFGGGVSYTRKRETAVEGALRELNEETLGILGTLLPQDVAGCPALIDKDMLVIFLRVDVPPHAISSAYLRAHAATTEEAPEVCSIQWFSLAELKALVTGSGMYRPLREFLARAGDFAALL